MSEKPYHVQGRYRYTHKSYKGDDNEEASDGFGLPSSMESVSSTDFPATCATCPACPGVHSDHECTSNAKAEIADILHKKCPVIKLANQQMREFLNQGQNYFSGDSVEASRSRAVIALIRRILENQGACATAAMLVVLMLLVGTVLGVGSCGPIRRQPNNPLLSCLANYIGISCKDDQFYSIY